MELDNKNSFGIGEGELIEIIYELPLPMRLDRWLVSKRPEQSRACLLYTSPSPRDLSTSRMPSSA